MLAERWVYPPPGVEVAQALEKAAFRIGRKMYGQEDWKSRSLGTVERGMHHSAHRIAFVADCRTRNRDSTRWTFPLMVDQGNSRPYICKVNLWFGLLVTIDYTTLF
jgi:hypothetical protein